MADHPPGERRRVRGAEEVRRLVAAHLPGHPVNPVERLGQGMDHQAFLVAGRLVVRLAREPDPAERAAAVERDLLLLRAVARVSPLPVPVPAFAVPAAGCVAYVPLDGVPLLHLPPHRRAAHAAPVGRALGAFLAALHAVPLVRVRGVVETDDRTAQAWRDEAAATYTRVAHAIPAAHRPRVLAFLGDPPTEAFVRVPLRFTHNDLGIEHVLVDPATGEVRGIIDWSDAAVADPASDFARLERDLGPNAVEFALAAYRREGGGGSDAAGLARLRTRAAFLARCLVLEDLAYGMEEGAGAYAEKSIAALAWLFPA